MDDDDALLAKAGITLFGLPEVAAETAEWIREIDAAWKRLATHERHHWIGEATKPRTSKKNNCLSEDLP